MEYKAFISYRHVNPDRKWAKWLHNKLETYRIPNQVVKENKTKRIGRVFRDEEELPASSDLSREIDSALEKSQFLVVICSPRTPESKWINQEIIRFRELGRHDRILALFVPANAEPVSMGEDSNGNDVNYPFGDEGAVSFSNPSDLTTQITFAAPGTYRLRLNVGDGRATGYHTVFVEVRR